MCVCEPFAAGAFNLTGSGAGDQSRGHCGALGVDAKDRVNLIGEDDGLGRLGQLSLGHAILLRIVWHDARDAGRDEGWPTPEKAGTGGISSDSKDGVFSESTRYWAEEFLEQLVG